MLKKLATILNPEAFQGRGRKRCYFEGWYSKIVNAQETKAFAFIPGIAIDAHGNRQSFVQVLDGKKKLALYHKYPFDDFNAASGAFDIHVGGCSFSKESMTLSLPGIAGTLRYKKSTPWPSRWYSPGIMGPFTFVPFMECYHGIVSMDHTLEGQLVMEGETVDFTGGRGYIEKDWGRSFPRAYVWMQSNHFSVKGISCKLSIAKIPWLGASFTGYIAGVWLGDHLLQFTTYNGTSLRKLAVTSEIIELILENRRYRLEVVAYRDDATALASPIQGFMDGRIEESMTSRMEVLITDREDGHTVFHDTGRNTGLEVAGSINDLLKQV